MEAENKSFAAGKEFAEYLNNTPREAQNWGKLGPNDDLPNGDYVMLRDEFGEVTPRMEQAFKRGFNSAFTPINDDGN